MDRMRMHGMEPAQRAGPRIMVGVLAAPGAEVGVVAIPIEDRKSTRLNSSHVRISYAVFCLKKKQSRRNTDSNDERAPRENVSLLGASAVPGGDAELCHQADIGQLGL